MKSAATVGRSATTRILVVDDSPELLSLTDAILSAAGYEVIASAEGLIALQIIELMPPELIVLDITMPQIDGYEMTRRIRSNSTWDLVPILLSTALDFSEAKLGLECGADDILSKPFTIANLLDKVGILLNSRYQRQLRAG